MKVVALIVAYWPQRFPSIAQIVDDLRASSRPPDHIMVLNNNPREIFLERIEYPVINCGANYTSRGKYAAALLEPADYYLLLDDDVSVLPELLGAWLELAWPGCAFSDVGQVMINNFASSAALVAGRDIEAPENCDMFQGSIQLLSFEAIVRMLAAEQGVRLPHLPQFRSVGEDLLIALANGNNAKVVPVKDYANRKAMPQGGVAMQDDFGYFQLRDWFFYEAWIALGRRPFPGPAPTDDVTIKRAMEYLQTLEDRDNA